MEIISEIWGLVCQHAKPLLTTVGLLCDIIGAWLLANELFNNLRVTDRIDVVATYGGSNVEETDESQVWQHKHNRRLGWGLGFLTGGFTLQIVAVWIW